MLKLLAKNKGFTLIELVIVVILLGVLAAIALPRFFNISGKARSAVVQSTGGAFSAALSVAKAQWELNRAGTDYVDIKGGNENSPSRYTKFNDEGYPVGISADGVHPLAEINDGGTKGNDTCTQIFNNLVKTSGIAVIPADESGKCASGDFCASASGKNTCTYIYRKNNEKIIYDAEKGEVYY